MTTSELLATGTKSLEDRIQEIEDKDAILAVMATYHHYVDKGWGGKDLDLSRLSEVFTDDVVWGMTMDASVQPASAGACNGLDEVVEMLRATLGSFEFTFHTYQNPVITVDGDSASGAMNLCVGARQGGVDNLWFLRADCHYVRTELGWRIKTLSVDFASSLHPVTAP